MNGLEVLDRLPLHIFDQVKYENQVFYQPLTDASSSNSNVEKYRNEGLINGLQISSQLARNSEQYFGTLSNVFTVRQLYFILQNASPIIRAKGCNLVGNLCR